MSNQPTPTPKAGPHEAEMLRQIKEGWIPDAEYRIFHGGVFAVDYCGEIIAERDQLRAELAQKREALETIDRELNTISDGKQEEIRSDMTAGEAHGWTDAYHHVHGIVATALSTPAGDWLTAHDAKVREPLERQVAARKEAEGETR